MTDIQFLNYFGNPSDFDNLKKWFRNNAESYKELLSATKERCELEVDYANRLTKIGQKIIKAFMHNQGSIGASWTKAANLIIEEGDSHKAYSSLLNEEVLKPLVNISDTFIKSKKPVEADIDKCLKALQDKLDEEVRLKRKSHSSVKESEKAYESVQDYIKTHSSSIQGTDKERMKIEKRAFHMNDTCVKTEVDYYECSLGLEDIRHKWEQSYIKGLEKLQNIEVERLKQMENVLNAYHKSFNTIPVTHNQFSEKLSEICRNVNISNDILDNSLIATNKSPTKYKTEQYMLELYSENKDNPMDLQRRLQNLSKRINVLYQHLKTYDNLRCGALKLIQVYEDKPNFADEITKQKTKSEYSKYQCLVNLMSANIYKLQCCLNRFQSKPEPNNPLQPGMQIANSQSDKTSTVQTLLVSSPGSIMDPYNPGVMPMEYSSVTSSSGSSRLPIVDDNVDVFDTDSDEEVAPVPPVSHNAHSIPLRNSAYNNVKSRHSTASISRDVSITSKSNIRPLPSLPKQNTLSSRMSNYSNSRPACRALHAFTGRDQEELTFNEGEIILIINKVSDVWWEGELRGRKGLIPVSYVQEL